MLQLLEFYVASCDKDNCQIYRFLVYFKHLYDLWKQKKFDYFLYSIELNFLFHKIIT